MQEKRQTCSEVAKMEMDWNLPLPDWDGTKRNFVFLGEAGCGKSEIAVNLALRLAARGDYPVHFFDLDMTKPLFRSRELAQPLTERGITFHFEEQYMDAPTTVGGPGANLRRDDCYTVLDVGGDYMGARSVGQYAPWFRKSYTAVYYVINPYRPWPDTTERIDIVLLDILTVSHLTLQDLRHVSNPNLGGGTTAEQVLEGRRMLRDTVEPYKPLDFYCAENSLADVIAGGLDRLVMALRLFFNIRGASRAPINGYGGQAGRKNGKRRARTWQE